MELTVGLLIAPKWSAAKSLLIIFVADSFARFGFYEVMRYVMRGIGMPEDFVSGVSCDLNLHYLCHLHHFVVYMVLSAP